MTGVDYRSGCAPPTSAKTPVTCHLYLRPPCLLCPPRYFAILGLGGDYVFSWMNFLGINLSIIGSLVYAHQEYVNRWVGGWLAQGLLAQPLVVGGALAVASKPCS